MHNAGASQEICLCCRLGRVDYLQAWELQKKLAYLVAGGAPDTLLLLEHPPTYTLGRRRGESNMLVPRERLISLGAAVINSDRGGDITFHGPGQLIGYPVLNLDRMQIGPGNYLRSLEDTIVRALADVNVHAGRCDGYTGVWVGDEKIAAIGVKITAKWVTQHGFAINLNTDLDYFSHIIPCGIKDRGVTTLSRIVGHEVCPEEFVGHVAEAFGVVFNRKLVEVSGDELIS